jgi:hypothetical protein
MLTYADVCTEKCSIYIGESDDEESSEDEAIVNPRKLLLQVPTKPLCY